MRTFLGGTTPICITYRRGSERPVIKRTRKFVGWRSLVKNAIGLIANALDSIAYSEEERLELPEDTVSVHWALEIDDPWGTDHESQLVALRVPEVPPAGTHFEIFKVDKAAPKKAPPTPPGSATVIRNGKKSIVPIDQLKSVRDAIMAQGLYDPEAGPTDL